MRAILTLWIIGCLAVSAWAQAEKSENEKSAAPPQEPQKTKSDEQSKEKPQPTVRLRSSVAILMTRLPDVRFDDVPLQQVVEWLGTAGETNVVVRWNRLEEAGVDRDQPISFTARQMRFGRALQLILQTATEDGATLAYRISDNLVVISTEADFNRQMLTKIYDIEDLLVTEQGGQAFFGREHDIPTSVRPVVAAGAVATVPITETWSSGTFVRYGGNSRREDRAERADQDREKHIAQLIEAITGTIEPESWDINGGPGSIREFRGRLIVRNSPLVHQKIGGPLVSDEAP